jgi:hypothetical protein
MNRPVALVLLFGLIILLAAGFMVYRSYVGPTSLSAVRTARVIQWINNPSAHPDWAVAENVTCGQAPFRMPTSGLVGYLWDDSFQPGKRHQGIDIFGGGQVGETPIVAAYPGYLTRLSDWKSTVIIRIPSDPLHPGRQIWTYYTHMADSSGASLINAKFPPGTNEVLVQAGDLLGHQGDYSGDPANPVGVHLHFSIVQDDGTGKFRNELEIGNTYDPSPYLGLPLNGRANQEAVVECK